MQYEITLPADYDMRIIEERVATRGHRTDDFAGLGLKAYLIRERGVDGSEVNQYAPFYVWSDTTGMSRFLFERAGFHGIVRDFGRPVVRHWTGALVLTGAQAAPHADQRSGPQHSSPPHGTPPHDVPVGELQAWRSVETLPPDIDPADAVDAAREDAKRLAVDAHTVAVGVDPTSWELVRFALTVGTPPARPGTRYRVLHVSTPDTAR